MTIANLGKAPDAFAEQIVDQYEGEGKGLVLDALIDTKMSVAHNKEQIRSIHVMVDGIIDDPVGLPTEIVQWAGDVHGQTGRYIDYLDELEVELGSHIEEVK